MRRLARRSIYGTAALCVVIWIAVWTSPKVFDGLGAWWRERATQQQLERFRAVETARTGSDPGEVLQALGSWSEALALVRKLDRLAPVARWVEQQASHTAELAGARHEAIAHARRAVAFDERDVDAIARLGRLLVAAPDSRDEAIELLAPFWRRLPYLAALAVPLARGLLDRGEANAAAEILLASGLAAPSDIWHVQWSDDPRDVSFVLLRNAGDGRIESRFAIDAPFQQLRIRLPAFRAVILRGARLRIEDGAIATEHALCELPHTSTSLRDDAGTLVAPGVRDQELRVELPRCFGAGSVVTISAQQEDRLATGLRDALLGLLGEELVSQLAIDASERRQNLARLRARALSESGLTVTTAPSAAGTLLRLRLPDTDWVPPTTNDDAIVLACDLHADARTLSIAVPKDHMLRATECDLELRDERGTVVGAVRSVKLGEPLAFDVTARSTDTLNLSIARTQQ